MTRRLVIRIVGTVLFLSAASSLSAEDVPLSNWTVPPYRTASAQGGMSTMADVTPGIGFVGVAPCRLVDTRLGSFPAGYGPPALSQGVPRNFDLNSSPLCTNTPAGVEAYSLNITVTNTQGPGFILIYPQGGSQPPVSTLNYLANETVANAAIVPAGTNGGVTVIAGVSGTQLIIDINGYFTDEYNTGVSFHAVSNSVAPAILAENTSTVANAVAIQGVITSTTPGDFATAVLAINNGDGYGVHGSSANGFGVVAGGGVGGVWATTGGAGANAVFGLASATTGAGKGVYGETASNFNGAGVFGTTKGLVTGLQTSPAGVRGESAGSFGVIGFSSDGSTGAGVYGALYAIPLIEGYLARDSAGGNYGVYSMGNAHVQGTFTATTNKGFVQPHPHDASKEIRYIALEGPHTEVYFRGTAQVSRGVTRISIPQHFRFVADSATYSTLVTPVGAMATVAVLDEGPEGILVQASRDVKVHYVVYAEREAVRNPDPIIENVHFRSDPEGDFLAHLPDTFRQLMIQNGTLHPDGRINLETARRLGWDKEWEKRERPAPQPVAD